MKKIILMSMAGVALLGSTLLSSCNFLDVDDYFEATFKEDSIFANKEYADGYLWNTPQEFPDAGDIWGNSWTPGETASDEICVKWQTSEFWGAQFTVGTINERNVSNWSQWQRMYRIIRRCNYMLQNYQNVRDMNTSEKQQYAAYVHFMRGYAYYCLLVNWGPILCVNDEVMPTSEDAAFYDRERMTFDESIEYIVNEFGQAVKYLNLPQQQSVAYFQRPTRGAALAMIARLRLLWASPTFNGGSLARRAYANWTRKSDGAHYINQNYDPTRWAVAAAAAKQVIDLDYYQLHTVGLDKAMPYELDPSVPTADFPDGAGNIDPYHSYLDMFDGETPANVNREIIWTTTSASSNVVEYTRHSFPVKYGGWGGMSVPQRVIDCFLMKDGKLPSESPHYEPDLTKVTTAVKTLSDYTLRNNVPEMYNNRSARFYACIGFPGRYWTMSSASSDASWVNKQFWYSNDDMEAGKSAAGNNPNDYCISGYVPVKYIHPDDSWSSANGSSRTSKVVPVIRYGEVLLEFVEAMNNIEAAANVQTWNTNGDLVDVSISRDPQQMAYYFNQIRYRVGLPGVDEATLNNATAFDKVIKNERQVELFNEGYRYMDTRRWGNYTDDDANTANWRGLDVNRDRTNANGNEGFWNIVTINEQNIRDRVARPRMIFLPLSHDQLLKSPSMDQNYGWSR